MTQHDDITPADSIPAEPAPSAAGAPVPGAPVPGAPVPGAPAATDAAAADAASSDEAPPTVDEVRAALRRVKDPELNLNIVDLGLIYEVAVDGRAVKVDMSLTSPGCPSGPEIMRDAEQQVKGVPGVTEATINLVWSPIWTPDRIEPRVRSYLGF